MSESRALDRLRLRLRSLFDRRRVDAELQAELDLHVEMQTAEYVAAGVPPREARERALRLLGARGPVEEECRDTRRTRPLETFLQDLRYGIRALRWNPLFAVMAALSLALGIGANTAIFSLAHALLLRPLPVERPAELVAVGDPSHANAYSEGGMRDDLMSTPMYRLLREQVSAFDGLYASGRAGRVLVGADGGGEPEVARTRVVSGNFFSLLGVHAWRGRTFTADEDRTPAAAPVAVISFDYWQRRFGGEAGAVGRTLVLNDQPFSVVGVAPKGFFGDVVGGPIDVWLPLAAQPQLNPGHDWRERWDVQWLLLMGRLRPGATVEQARAEVQAAFDRVVTGRAGAVMDPAWLPEDLSKLRVPVEPGGHGFSALREYLRQPLPTLVTLVALVLLVACVNIANLLLERATSRQQEITVRLALGAGRGRLVRQLLTESLVLALVGGGLGVLVAWGADVGLLALLDLPRSTLDLRPDATVLGFTVAVALLTGVAFGLAPALAATRSALAPALRERSRSSTGSGGARRPLARLLVVAQVAVSLLLLAGAGLFVRSLRNLQTTDLGYDSRGLVMLGVDPLSAGYTGERIGPMVNDLLARLAALPGVAAVSLSENGIFSGTESNTAIVVAGQPPRVDDQGLAYDRVGPRYFETIGIRILRGRGIGPRDVAGTPPVAVVNEALAREYFPGEDPIGRRFAEKVKPEVVYEIVGVSADARDHDLRGEVGPRYYAPLLQALDDVSTFNVELRSSSHSGRAGALTPRLRAAVRDAARAVDPRLRVVGPLAVNRSIEASLSGDRLVATLATVLGLLALVLASIGLYGVVAHATARRTNEIGIRMVMGARRRAVVWMVLRETLLLAGAGIGVGLVAVLGSSKLIASRLQGLSPHDLPTLVTAALVLLAVGLVAGSIPGARAATIDPVRSLRQE